MFKAKGCDIHTLRDKTRKAGIVEDGWLENKVLPKDSPMAAHFKGH
jgi:hypothetical protein